MSYKEVIKVSRSERLIFQALERLEAMRWPRWIECFKKETDKPASKEASDKERVSFLSKGTKDCER